MKKKDSGYIPPSVWYLVVLSVIILVVFLFYVSNKKQSQSILPVGQRASQSVPESELKFFPKAEEIKVEVGNRITFDYANQLINFEGNGVKESFDSNYSNTDMFDYGLNHDNIIGITHIIPAYGSLDYELLAYNFQTKSLLNIDVALTNVLKNIRAENESRFIEYYWSPVGNDLVLLIQGMYDTKGKLIKVRYDESVQSIIFVKEFQIPNAMSLNVLGWNSAGTELAVVVANKIVSEGNNGAMIATEKSYIIISNDTVITYLDSTTDSEKILDLQKYEESYKPVGKKPILN